MSYLFGGESVQSRQDTFQDISESSFNQEDEAYKNRLDETISNATTPARIATRSIANLGIAADAIPTAIGTYYGIDNPGWHKHVTQSLIHTRDALTPDPQTTHVSLQIADQFAGMGMDFALAGGNPLAFSAIQGGKRVTEELEKGKSLGTSLDLGTVDALLNLGMTKLPLGFASKKIPINARIQGATSGGAIGVTTGIAGEMANEAVLNSAGYPEEAKQHDWSNPATLALNAAFGAVFGGLHPHVLPSHQDAVLTAMDAHAIENPDNLSATNPASNNALVDGMNKSVRELVDGVPITSSIRFTEKPEIPADLLALAGERMSRGERQPLEQQKADLEYKLKQIEEGDYTQQGLDLANEQQAKIDLENTGKRIPARKLAEQRKSNLETANDLGENVRQKDAQLHQDSLVRLNEMLIKDDEARAAHAEMSRIEQQHLFDNGFIQHPETKKMQADIQEQIKQSVIQTEGESFADRTGRTYDALNYKDGTAHLFNQVLDFYNNHVSHLPAKGGDLMPDSLFRIGRIDDNTAMELSYFLPGFHNGLREARISAQSIKHIHDSRADIAKEVLARLENGVLKADEVLPNPNSPANKNRAYLVLKDIGHENDNNKRGATVVEVSANGKGIDIVSSMTMPDRSLKKARELKKKMELSRSEGQQLGNEPNSPHRHLSEKYQTHAAADSLHFERDSKNINQIHTNVNKNDTPEIISAREAIPSIESDRQFEIEHDDGTIDRGSASELMARADEEAAFAEQSDTATTAAISCFLKFGDL